MTPATSSPPSHPIPFTPDRPGNCVCYRLRSKILDRRFCVCERWVRGGRAQPSVIRTDEARLGGVRGRHFLPHTSTMPVQDKLCSVSFLIRLISLCFYCAWPPNAGVFLTCVGISRELPSGWTPLRTGPKCQSKDLVRVRPDSSRTWDYAITNAKVGREKRVYLQKVAMCSFLWNRCSLGPAASHFTVEGPRHREPNPAAFGQSFPARRH